MAAPITATRKISISPAEAYRAFSNSTLLRDWLCDAAEVEPRKGGRFYLWWSTGAHAAGEYAAADPGKKIAIRWHHNREPEPTQVKVTFAARKTGTLVTVRHDIGPGRKWAAAAKAARSAWEDALENLQSVLETGIDLRIMRLPRMGVFIDNFNADIARDLGVPVQQGMRLAGVADGTGAQAAGLQKDDVLVSLGGKKLTDFHSLGRALRARTAGDKVAVVFYRGGRKTTVQMELSKRPAPEIPVTLDEFVETVSKNYADLDAAWATLIEGVSDDEAARWPALNEWSLKESVAHFILVERDTQSWFAQMVNDGEIGESLEFRTNVNARVRAVVEVYPTLATLIDELKRSEQETVAMLRGLPAQFVARKHFFARAAQWMLQVIPSHYHDEHLGLMQSAIRSAKQKG